MKADISNANADTILGEYNIVLKGARQNERLALAKGLAQLHALYGDKAKFAQNVRFSFGSRRGYSRYEGYSGGRHHISMNRCNSKGRGCASNNVAHLLHELGHRVGHAFYKGRLNFYEAYARYAGRCHPTRYSRKNVREQFAEVFAAFVTYPEILRHGNSDCRRAYAFFASDVFYQNGGLSTCSGLDRQTLAAIYYREHPTNNQVAKERSNDLWMVSEAPSKGPRSRLLNQRVTWEPIPEFEDDDRMPNIPPEDWDYFDTAMDAGVDNTPRRYKTAHSDNDDEFTSGM